MTSKRKVMENGRGHVQHAKKVLFDSLGLEDFAVGVVNFVLVSLPNRQVKFFENSNYRSTV